VQLGRSFIWLNQLSALPLPPPQPPRRHVAESSSQRAPVGRGARSSSGPFWVLPWSTSWRKTHARCVSSSSRHQDRFRSPLRFSSPPSPGVRSYLSSAQRGWVNFAIASASRRHSQPRPHPHPPAKPKLRPLTGPPEQSQETRGEKSPLLAYGSSGEFGWATVIPIVAAVATQMAAKRIELPPTSL
jgi:hypothetical protein